MKRDMDLIRKLLLLIESSEEPHLVSSEIEIEGHDTGAIVYHCALLNDAGLIDASDCGDREHREDLFINRLTWTGHEFVDAARSNKLWNAVTGEVKTRITTITFEGLFSLLKLAGQRAMTEGTDWFRSFAEQ